MKTTKTRNSDTLADFIKYCVDHPEERFWQALRNWAGVGFIFVGDGKNIEDTFYREGKYK